MRFQIAYILGVLVTVEALALNTVEKRSSNAGDEEMTGTIVTPLEARTDIEVIAGMVSHGIYTGAIIAGWAVYFANNIKTQSDLNSCTVISGNIDRTVWQYQATTSGKNCDTTAEVKTIKNAVQRELDWMLKNDINQACFKMDHGGTWEGHLKISTAGKPIATDSQCNAAKYIPL